MTGRRSRSGRSAALLAAAWRSACAHDRGRRAAPLPRGSAALARPRRPARASTRRARRTRSSTSPRSSASATSSWWPRIRGSTRGCRPTARAWSCPTCACCRADAARASSSTSATCASTTSRRASRRAQLSDRHREGRLRDAARRHRGEGQAREADLGARASRRGATATPRCVEPGPDNPLGEYALYLGWPSYLIHGTNDPARRRAATRAAAASASTRTTSPSCTRASRRARRCAS